MADWSDSPNVRAEVKDAVEWGKKAERERILALLEARQNDLMSCLKDDDCSVRAEAIDVCISVIKGENK